MTARDRKPGVPDGARICVRNDGALRASQAPSANQVCILDDLDKEADANIRGNDEVHRHIWNRVHLNALKIATSIAVADSPSFQFVVRSAHARWAANYVRRSALTLLRRFETGEAGGGETSQAVATIKEKVARFERLSPTEREKKGVPMAMLTGNYIPFVYLYHSLVAPSGVKPFRTKPELLDRTLRDLVKADVLVQLDPTDAWQKLKSRKPVYAKGPSWK